MFSDLMASYFRLHNNVLCQPTKEEVAPFIFFAQCTLQSSCKNCCCQEQGWVQEELRYSCRDIPLKICSERKLRVSYPSTHPLLASIFASICPSLPVDRPHVDSSLWLGKSLFEGAWSLSNDFSHWALEERN